MSASVFPGQAARSSPGRLELVHVESGSVLASRVRIDRLATRQHLAWLRGNSEPGDEAALIVAPARWAHTFFASAPTDVAFVDGDGRVVALRRSMKPWRVMLAPGANSAIQAMPGFITRTRTRVGDRVTLREEQAARPVRDAASWHADFGQVSESARAEFRESVNAGLQDADSQVDPWGVDADEPQDARPQPPVASAPAALPVRAESGDAGRPKPTPGRAFLKGVDLAALTARETPIAWFEAVAIVQEMCAVLLQSRRGGPPAEFEPEDVAITAEGGVEVRGGASHGLPTVPQVGHVLLTLLGEAQTLPVQLRLLALQEVSPTPRCSTVGEFSNQLNVFERPNRQATIREVFQRYMSLPVRPIERASAAPKASPRATHQPGAVRVPIWRRRPFRLAAAAILVVAVSGAVAALLWRSGGSLFWRSADVGAAGSTAGESLADDAVTRIREAALRIWGAEAPRRAPVPARGLPPQPAAFELPSAAPGRPFPAPAAGDAPSSAAAAVNPAVAATRVFSTSDAEVEPPVLQRPHLPASPRPGVRLEDLPQIEIVVSPAGEVESVKLLTPSAGVHSAMMLSAIKTWHFQPASRDGHPVRYRLTLRLTNQ